MCRDTIRLSDVGWKLNITWINRVSNIKNRGGRGGGKEENLISFYFRGISFNWKWSFIVSTVSNVVKIPKIYNWIKIERVRLRTWVQVVIYTVKVIYVYFVKSRIDKIKNFYPFTNNRIYHCVVNLYFYRKKFTLQNLHTEKQATI